MIYVLTEFLGGNGAIAALFLGLVLRNSKQLTSLFSSIINPKVDAKKAVDGELGVAVVSQTEEFFYSQISFFLKTFFFVYIGILISLSDTNALLYGLLIALVLMFARNFSKYLVTDFSPFEKEVAGSIFARGLAAAAVAQILVLSNVPKAQEIANIVYAVITFSIILSSLKVFLARKSNAPKMKIASPSVKG